MNTRILTAIVLAITSGLITTGGALAQHADINPFESNGRVHTAGIDHDTGTIIGANQRVFEGEIDLLPDNITPVVVGGDEPGFDTEGAHSNKLPAGAEMGFNIVTLPTAILPGQENIAYWDGTGGVVFTTVPASASLTLRDSNNPFTFVTASGDNSAVTGFTVGTADGAGDLHTHIDIEFLPASNDPFDLPGGIYLISLELTATGLQNAAPIFLVLNYGLDEEAHEAALDFVTATIPEPASMTLLGAGALLLLARRRRNA